MSTTTMERPAEFESRLPATSSLAQRLIATTRSVAPTVARVGLGGVMFVHGAQKMLGLWGGHGLSATMSMMTTKLGIPAPFALLAVFAEFFGAIGLITGFLTRIAAAGIAVVMIVAVAMVHRGNGFFMNWDGHQRGEGFEYHLLALALCGMIMIAGGGWASLDRWLATRRGRVVGPPVI